MINHLLKFSKNEDLTHVSGVKTLTYNLQIKITIIKKKNPASRKTLCTPGWMRLKGALLPSGQVVIKLYFTL